MPAFEGLDVAYATIYKSSKDDVLEKRFYTFPVAALDRYFVAPTQSH
jgi:hypothetical protein